MKKILSVILALCMLLSVGVVAFAEGVNPFVDVPENAWYRNEVVKAVETGIINGKSETEFKPDDLLTYAEAVKLAACMNQVYVDGMVTLANGTPWYQHYADFCKVKGIITKDYDYNAFATRAGYMEIFANALPDEAFADINNIPDGSILDVKDNSPYAIYVYKLYRSGIVAGVDELHNCNPDANIKRCEVATIISRMMDEGKRVQFDMQKNGESSEEEPAEPGKDNQKVVESENDKPKDEVVLDIPKVEINGQESIVVGGNEEKPKYDVGGEDFIISVLTIHKEPEGLEADNYGIEHKLEVQVFGGKPPYTYEWTYKVRKDTVTIRNGDFVKGADTNAMVLSVEKENNLLGQPISCKVTDTEGTVVTTKNVIVYGPFSMPVESLTDNGNYVLVGRIADGVIRKGDKVSVERNGKIIATGVAVDLEMFEKSLDEGKKGDYMGIIFDLDKGVRPTTGDVVIKYKDTHVVDTSDIVN